VDWSRGGDGIVVRRASVRTANDLRGKTIALAAFSPSHYYALTVLRAAGIAPADVKFFYTTTAFGAARAFYEREDIDAVVSFAPDIYTLTEGEAGEKFRLLTSTQDAQRLIADVWAVRTDFAVEHPDVVEGLVRGIFEGMDLVRQDKAQAARWMYEGYRAYDIPSPEVCEAMIGDAHLTGFGENLDFYTNEKNPANFERTWSDAVRIWKELGVLAAEIPASEVANTRVLRTPSVAKRFAAQQLPPEAPAGAPVELDPEKAVLTMTVYFDAAREQVDPDSAEVRRALEEIARLAGKFSGAAIVVAGYTDPVGAGLLELEARKGDNRQVPRILAAYTRRLEAFSADRANFVLEALTERYALRAQQLRVSARGGRDPVTTDHAQRWRNRRVEVTVVPLGQ
jgi:outer membrane protein OmpA-like peptidoglycan-associated protein